MSDDRHRSFRHTAVIVLKGGISKQEYAYEYQLDNVSQDISREVVKEGTDCVEKTRDVVEHLVMARASTPRKAESSTT